MKPRNISSIGLYRTVPLAFFTIFLLACILPGLSLTPTPIPPDETISQEALGTLVAGTADAARIQTASSLPTITRTFTVTRVPSETFTFTPTFIFLLPTATPVPSYTPIVPPGNIVVKGTTEVDKRLTGRPWTCLVTGSTPPRNVPQKPGKDFYVTWTVMNTGTKTWSNNGIDFVFESGYRTEQRQLQDLPRSVVSGASINLKVLLTAPKVEGTYQAIWQLKVGQKVFCRMVIVFLI